MVGLGLDVPIGKRRLPGWNGSLMFYAFMCPEHGVVIDYIHGYNDAPSCPKCAEEKIK